MRKISCSFNIPDEDVEDFVKELVEDGQNFLASLLLPDSPAGRLCKYELDELVLTVRERAGAVIS